jgi:thiamine-phosphate pyrophosphorylase
MILNMNRGRLISNLGEVLSDCSVESRGGLALGPPKGVVLGRSPSRSRPYRDLRPMATQQQAIYRILDANLDRAREGLRIIEDWCRFGLNHSAWAEDCKAMRQAIGGWHRDEFRAARNTPEDVGTQLSHPKEEQRVDISAVLQANFCRVQEALRVLEEYGKLDNADLSIGCKQLRYRVYGLESQVMGQQVVGQQVIDQTQGQDRLSRLHRAKLYLVTSPVENILAIVEAALQGGLTLVQYREKQANDQVRLEIALGLKALCHRYGALFLVNDRVDLALVVDADGVHLGQQDLPIALARKLLGPDKIVGKSTTSPAEMALALSEHPDYIGVGPVFETPTKPGKAAAGYDYVRYAAEHSPVPWYAIGSVDAQNLGGVLDAGATRVAVVRSIMQAEQPMVATQELLAQLDRSSG